jgi:hypothetical protein
MAYEDTPLFVGLIAANVLLYALFVLKLSRNRKEGAGSQLSSSEVFRRLEEVVSSKGLGLPAGFTWKEAFARLRRLFPWAEWQKLQVELTAYEGYRYGGKENPAQSVEVYALLRRLKKVGRTV